MKNINNEIKTEKVILIDVSGVTKGTMLTKNALDEAFSRGLDLVQMNDEEIPVCKIMDYKKEQYKQKKKAKKQHVPTTKKLLFRPNTDKNDLNRIIKQAQGFIDNNDNVVFVAKFKGREVTYANKVLESFNMIEETLNIPGNYTLKQDSVVNNNKMHLIISK